ncbi:hypothetical protein D3C75_395580 [compost metagenome]
MRINLCLQGFELGLFFRNLLHINPVYKLLDVSRHIIKGISNLYKFIVSREADPFLKITLLEGTHQSNDPAHLAA